jgi:hypothetical protein
MAEHDYVIDNDSASAARADINSALLAIVSNNSKATAPTTTFAYMWWNDTTANILKMRNSANSAWISIGTLDNSLNTFTYTNVDANINTHLNTGTATASQVLSWTGSDYDWVDATPAQSTAHLAIGTYHMLGKYSTTNLAVGATVAGTDLKYSTTAVSASNSASMSSNTTGQVAVTGTWRLMGPNALSHSTERTTTTYGVGLFVRIS